MWVQNQARDLLDISYFHVVFTVPANLNVIFLHNPETMYALLFRCAAQSMQELCDDKRYLGAKVGLTAVLHTWGQQLQFHPHVHCIVPSGGLTPTNRWKNSKKDFFLPVKVLSAKFKGKFLAHLKKTVLTFYNESTCLSDPACFAALIDAAYAKDWVVYCKKPFKNNHSVVEYLGRYTHRVAISNERILSHENGKVSFRWRDRADGNNLKVMSLDEDEFIRRFLLHILPSGFMKIRHYGILANKDRHKRIDMCKRLTNTPVTERMRIDPLEVICRIIGHRPGVCLVCGVVMFAAPLLA
jgi:hypothetical protein